MCVCNLHMFCVWCTCNTRLSFSGTPNAVETPLGQQPQVSSTRDIYTQPAESGEGTTSPCNARPRARFQMTDPWDAPRSAQTLPHKRFERGSQMTKIVDWRPSSGQSHQLAARWLDRRQQSSVQLPLSDRWGQRNSVRSSTSPMHDVTMRCQNPRLSAGHLLKT